MTFSLWDAPGSGAPPTGGTQVGGNHVIPSVPVVNGLFTVLLNDAAQFGPNAFNGQERWLQAAVQCTGDGAPVALSRQPLTAAPYALYARGNWGLTGNASTSANNFVGTTDNMSLTIGVNGTAALRIYPNATSPNLIGGSQYNRVTVAARGVTIGGGGSTYFPNRASNSFATVSGGYDNSASGDSSTVGGGESNLASATYATVAGGYGNNASGDSSTVSGGEGNLASGQSSFAAGTSACAVHDGAFVWADSTYRLFTSGGVNHFDVRATGGISLVTSIDGSGNPTSGLFVSNAGKTTVSSLQVSSNGTQFNRMQADTAMLGGGTGGVTNFYTVTFPVAFSATPHVIVTPRNNWSTPIGDTFAVTLRAVSATQFVVNVYRTDSPGSWSQNLQLDWFAWE